MVFLKKSRLDNSSQHEPIYIVVTSNLRITAAAQNGRFFLAHILLAVCLGETRASVLSTALQGDSPPSHSVTQRSPLITRIRGHHSASKQAWVAVCTLALKHPPEMTHITSNPISSAKASHWIPANVKGAGKCNPRLCPE